MDCLVKFGGNPPVKGRGRTAGDTLTVEYELNGAPFILAVSPDRVLHKAVGDGLEVEFIGGQKTVGVLRCGENTAPYPVFCSSLQVKDEGSDKRVTVVFDDGDSQKTVTVSLRIKGTD